MDLYSRRIVGWSMQPSLHRGLVLDALKMALQRRRPCQGLLHHSEMTDLMRSVTGSQYASLDYPGLLQASAMICSMSRRGNCWDNAPMESFFASLKREWVPVQSYRSRAEAQADIFEYVEIWYNRRRLHSSLGYVTPAAYEAAYFENTLSLAA